MISSQRPWPPDHKAGQKKDNYNFLIYETAYFLGSVWGKRHVTAPPTG